MEPSVEKTIREVCEAFRRDAKAANDGAFSEHAQTCATAIEARLLEALHAVRDGKAPSPDFVALVERLRTAQVLYFSMRTKETLQRAKNLERLVDAELQKLKATPAPQGDLFGKAGR